MSFRGGKKGEWRGVVDLLAIRKDTSAPDSTQLKRGDLFEIILIQVKGGSAALPTRDDRLRLKAVAKYHKAKAVVLFEWQKGKLCRFHRLGPRLEWQPTTARELFNGLPPLPWTVDDLRAQCSGWLLSKLTGER
jgi:hypothetical protein